MKNLYEFVTENCLLRRIEAGDVDTIFEIFSNYALLPKYWAQGIASEIIPKVVEIGFKSLELNRIHATTEPRNAASTKVLLNNGFKLEGRLRENWIYPGEGPTDTNVLGLIKSDWIQSKT
jgi:ribosomal-protein-alanine N-acetyltransferase